MSQQEKFKLMESLGAGGFAQTWLAKVLDPVLVEEWEVDEVALKIPLDKSKEVVLKGEIEKGAGLFLKMEQVEAENIVRYLGFDVFEGKIVMAMSYIAGGNLRQVMKSYGHYRPVDQERAISIVKGVLKGLSVIHRYSMVHRDIKPENILMDGDTPKIADFGIGRMLRNNQLASTSIGTIYYLSPELLYNKGIAGASFNTDIWSLGVMFYEMLCGCFPFDIRTVMPQGNLINNIVDENKPVRFPQDSTVPTRLQTVIEKALRKDPRERYQTAEEMLQDLTSIREKPEKTSLEERIEREIVSVLHRFPDPSQSNIVEKTLTQILKEHPEFPVVYLKVGEFYNKRGRYNEAINIFKRGLELDKDNPLLHWGVAIASLELGNHSQSEKSIKKALDLGLEASLERYAKILLTNVKQKGGR